MRFNDCLGLNHTTVRWWNQDAYPVSEFKSSTLLPSVVTSLRTHVLHSSHSILSQGKGQGSRKWFAFGIEMGFIVGRDTEAVSGPIETSGNCSLCPGQSI